MKRILPLLLLLSLGGCIGPRKCPNQDIINNMMVWIYLHGPLEITPSELQELQEFPEDFESWEPSDPN